MNKSTEKLLSFIKFTTEFQRVKRQLFATQENRLENDSEHSFQLALVTWYIIEKDRLSFDFNKIIKMALSHDLVEIYAGDTYFYTSDQNLKKTKIQREHEALRKISTEFSEFPDLVELISEYEERKSPEARFVYALDKILPVINIYLDDGRTWREIAKEVTLEIIIQMKSEKVAYSPEIEKYWSDIVEILKQNESRLFRVPN